MTRLGPIGNGQGYVDVRGEVALDVGKRADPPGRRRPGRIVISAILFAVAWALPLRGVVAVHGGRRGFVRIPVIVAAVRRQRVHVPTLTPEPRALEWL